MKPATRKITTAILFVTFALPMLAGCSGGGELFSTTGTDPDIVTFVNDTGYPVVIDPWGTLLYPGEIVDIFVGFDLVNVIVYREFDGLILFAGTVAGGETWYI